MPRTKEQNEAIRAEKKQIIMDAALQLFAEEGYVSVSIDKIARKAGIAKGLLYTYFKNKDDLLHQILIEGIEKVSGGLFPENMTMEDFVESVGKMFELMLEQKDFFMLYTALSVQPGVTQQLGPLTDTHNGLQHMITLFRNRYGENAAKELLLMSTLSKGFSILTLFGDRQHVIPIDLLKDTILDFIRERWVNSEQ
jgi:AcrR family transcriptional regulator